MRRPGLALLVSSASRVSAWNVLQDIGSIAGLVALLLGVWLSLRTLGVLNRPRYEISAAYLPRDEVGFGAMPHFVVEYRNTGNVPVTFSDFELALPRHDFIQGDKLVGHLGAELSSTRGSRRVSVRFNTCRPSTTARGRSSCPHRRLIRTTSISAHSCPTSIPSA